MIELEQLKKDLENVQNAIFMLSMSDNFCYSNGRIYPLLNKEKDIKEKIVELENESKVK